jgi:hypothetical protein
MLLIQGAFRAGGSAKHAVERVEASAFKVVVDPFRLFLSEASATDQRLCNARLVIFPFFFLFAS